LIKPLLLASLQSTDTIEINYGDPNFFKTSDSIEFVLRADLDDGFYRAYESQVRGEKTLRFSGLLLNQQRSGSWKYYTAHRYGVGSYLQEEKVFENGYWKETTRYYENGSAKSQYSYPPSSALSSDWKELRMWYRNGQLRLRVFTPKGESRYKQEGYYETGELQYEGHFDRHERTTGTWTFYHKNGNISKQGKYCNKCLNKGIRPILHGIPRGTWNFYNQQGHLIESKKHRHK